MNTPKQCARNPQPHGVNHLQQLLVIDCFVPKQSVQRHLIYSTVQALQPYGSIKTNAVYSRLQKQRCHTLAETCFKNHDTWNLVAPFPIHQYPRYALEPCPRPEQSWLGAKSQVRLAPPESCARSQKPGQRPIPHFGSSLPVPAPQSP